MYTYANGCIYICIYANQYGRLIKIINHERASQEP